MCAAGRALGVFWALAARRARLAARPEQGDCGRYSRLTQLVIGAVAGALAVKKSKARKTSVRRLTSAHSETSPPRNTGRERYLPRD